MPVSTMKAGTEKRVIRLTPPYGDAGPHADEWMSTTPTAATTRSASLAPSRGRGADAPAALTSGARAAASGVPRAWTSLRRLAWHLGDTRCTRDRAAPAHGAPRARSRA